MVRAILDTDEDVIRDIAIPSDALLMDLHQAIVLAFDLNKGEMSSFFRSDADWNQGQEISMMEFDPETQKNPLQTTHLHDSFGRKGARMLFAYDFLNLWTFYLEVMDVQQPDPEKNYPLLVGKLGETPEQAPDREMSAEGDDLLNGDLDDLDDLEDDFREEDWY